MRNSHSKISIDNESTYLLLHHGEFVNLYMIYLFCSGLFYLTLIIINFIELFQKINTIKNKITSSSHFFF